MTIVVGTDFSPAAEAAVKWAASEAERTDDDLLIAHSCVEPLALYAEHGVNPRAYQLDIPQILKAAGEVVDTAIDHVAERHPSIRVDKLVGRSEAGRLLVDASHDARLVVVGSHQRRLSTFVLGSTTRFVLNNAMANVAVVPTTARTGPAERLGRISVGVDGSTGAAHALEWAAGEAAVWNAALRVIYVADRSESEGDAQHQLSSALAVFSRDRHRGESIQSSGHVVRGPVADTLLSEAHDDDLLVVGSRGRRALRSTLLGSVARKVATEAPCVIVVVHRG
jgi:nucleotide-binding universal stress UspA family protein